MKAMAAPTNLKLKRESARRRSHMHRIHNASGGGHKNKLKSNANQTEDGRIVPHSQCKRWRPQRGVARGVARGAARGVARGGLAFEF